MSYGRAFSHAMTHGGIRLQSVICPQQSVVMYADIQGIRPQILGVYRYLTNFTVNLTTWNPNLRAPYTQLFHHVERMERKSILAMFSYRFIWQRRDNGRMADSAICHSMGKGPGRAARPYDIIWKKRPVIYLAYARIYKVYTWLNPN